MTPKTPKTNPRLVKNAKISDFQHFCQTFDKFRGLESSKHSKGKNFVNFEKMPQIETEIEKNSNKFKFLTFLSNCCQTFDYLASLES